MITVVKQDDVSCAHFFEPVLHIRGRLGVPVMSVYGPHHDLRKTCLTRCREELGAAEPVRGPNTGCPIAGRLYHGVVATPQFVRDPIAAEKDKAVMGISMIPDNVPARRDFRCEARMLLRIFAKDKERRPDVVFLEQRQEPRRHPRIGAVVECQSAGAPGAPDDRAKQL
jgi:hypothetical protein